MIIDIVLLVPFVASLLTHSLLITIIGAVSTTGGDHRFVTMMVVCTELLCTLKWLSFINAIYEEAPEIRLYLRQQLISTEGTVYTFKVSITYMQHDHFAFPLTSLFAFLGLFRLILYFIDTTNETLVWSLKFLCSTFFLWDFTVYMGFGPSVHFSVFRTTGIKSI